jgi:hypothetical protein
MHNVACVRRCFVCKLLCVHVYDVCGARACVCITHTCSLSHTHTCGTRACVKTGFCERELLHTNTKTHMLALTHTHICVTHSHMCHRIGVSDSVCYGDSVFRCVRLSRSAFSDFFYAVAVGNRMLQVANERGASRSTAAGHAPRGRGESLDNQPVTDGEESRETGHDAVVGES